MKRKRNEWLAGYMFISPFYILFIIFMLYPVLYSFYLSFFEWNGTGAMKPVGLRNYLTVIRDVDFWLSLRNTLSIGIGYVPVMLALALIFAIILNSPVLKWRETFRTVFFLPAVTSVVVVSLVFLLLFDSLGLVNWVITKLGFGTIPWLTKPAWAKISLIILIIWRWMGYNMVIMLAGLQSIPLAVYEAARIDGVTPLQNLLKITIPLMRPIILFCFVLSTIGTFQIVTEPYILTRGGPVNATLTMGLFLYRNSFEYFKFGYASSIAYAMVVIVFSLSWLQLVLARQRG